MTSLLVDALGEDRLGLLVRHAGVALDVCERLGEERVVLAEVLRRHAEVVIPVSLTRGFQIGEVGLMFADESYPG